MTNKALCVGINDYPFGEENDLRGCVNDANDWANLLRNDFGFDDVKQLLNGDATKDKIFAGLNELLAGAKSGDVLVFTNASHGTYVADKNGDESKFDEAICPCDTKPESLVLDDELRGLFKNIPDGVQFIVISDSCHSGSVTRVKESEYRRNRELNPRVWGGRTVEPDKLRSVRKAKPEKYPESGMREVLLSGCKANQTSADAHINGDFHGAMSYYAIQAIREGGPDQTYAQVHERLTQLLEEENYDQIPQLEGKEENKNRKIFT